MPDPTTCRPRIEGERESEIFAAVVALLVEAGYDKLTFDAVATAVRASKATLYRRWPTKADLVLDAVAAQLAAEPERDDDTGSLRGDLLAQACGPGGLCDDFPAVLGALVPAMHRDAELFAGFRRRFVEPKLDRALAAFERARDGERSARTPTCTCWPTRSRPSASTTCSSSTSTPPPSASPTCWTASSCPRRAPPSARAGRTGRPRHPPLSPTERTGRHVHHHRLDASPPQQDPAAPARAASASPSPSSAARS